MLPPPFPCAFRMEGTANTGRVTEHQAGSNMDLDELIAAVRECIENREAGTICFKFAVVIPDPEYVPGFRLLARIKHNV